MKKKLNELLSDLVIVSHKLQAYHWYVKGPDFQQAHLQLEELYTMVNTLVDEVAETMLMCGKKPVATCKEFLEVSDIKEAEAKFISPKSAFEEVRADFEHILKSTKSIKQDAEKNGEDIVGIKADAIIEQLSKTVWMLGQR